jgi:SWI/SNF-related matrix-associated actin-dependent regulator of chromatin subfamily A-like protein 1
MTVAPKPYQREDAAWCVERFKGGHRAAFLWHDMGTGKSCIMVLVAELVDAFNILVLCPAIARENWRREIQKWQTRKRPVFVVGIDGPVPPPRFNGWIVANYERLQDKNGELLRELRSRTYDVAFMDEHHYCSSPDAQRTNIIYRAHADGTANVVWLAGQMKRCVLASGTPMRNSPLDLWPHLYVWAPAAVFQGGTRLGRDAFRDQYCYTEWKTLPNGIVVEVNQRGRNEQDLLRRLSGLYRRRSREDVVGDLPALHVYAHPMATYGLARDRLEAAAREMGSFDRYALARQLEQATQEDKTYQSLFTEAALQRCSGVLELVNDCTPDPFLGGTPRKAILVAHHRDVMDELYEGLRNLDLAPVQIRGGQTPTDRQRAVDLFQEDRRVRTAVVQLQAGSTAVNLTAATDIFFVELDFTATNNAQVIARGYRIGQKNPLHVRLCLGDTPLEGAQQYVVANRLTSIETMLPDQINRALIAALTGEGPVYPDPQLGAEDDWLDGPAAPSAQRPADADAASDWLA